MGSTDRRGRPGSRGDSGQSTVEVAMAVPSLVLLLCLMVWGLLAAGAQIRCVDAARAGARAAARAESPERTVAAAREVAPAGAQVALSQEGPLVRVRVSARSAGPIGLGVEVFAEAVAQQERPVPARAPAGWGPDVERGGEVP